METKHLVDELGGPTALAKRLNIDGEPGAIQRVHNWRTRGIPAKVILDHPEVFAPLLPKREGSHA